MIITLNKFAFRILFIIWKHRLSGIEPEDQVMVPDVIVLQDFFDIKHEREITGLKQNQLIRLQGQPTPSQLHGVKQVQFVRIFPDERDVLPLCANRFQKSVCNSLNFF